jgi:16S rRNA (cytidine1402-2'-O)-methyltransferase
LGALAIAKKGTKKMSGMLYLCATPIGNLEDITFRVIEALKSVDIIAAEDTRNSIKLLNHYNINTPMTSYHEHNKHEKGKQLVERMRKGDSIALISDAGTPGISDPGEELVRMCYLEGIKVTSLPGASACITALSMSGQSTKRFVFEGFLPTGKKERRDRLKEIKDEVRTIVLYEAPHRLIKTLKELRETLGNREVSVCREITKRYEVVVKEKIEEVISYFEEKPPKGECVLVIAGREPKEIQKEEQESWQEISLEDHMDLYLSEGMDRKEAMKRVAKERGTSKREVYRQLLES